MKKKNDKGITLVALVVTIIILLILAGVTLSLALNEGGLFSRAQNAADRYKSAQANQVGQLSELDIELEKYGQGGSTGGIGSSEVEGELKKYQGKYVDIGLDTNDNSQVDDWEIFYAGNGRIFLIAADYVPVTKLTSWGVIGDGTTLKNNGFDSTSGTYNVYWSTPKTFLGYTDLNVVMHTGYSLDDNKNNPNSIAVSHLLNTDAWSGIKNAAGKNASIDFVIGGPTLEMWCAAWEKTVEGNADRFVALETDPQTSGTGYNVKYNGTSENWLYVTGSQSSQPDVSKLAEYNTFFPHVAVEQGCSGYWLASTSAVNSNCLLIIREVGSVTYRGYNVSDFGVRPVVSLASGVQIVAKEGAENQYDVTK